MSDPSPWDTSSPVAAVGGGAGGVSLVQGQTFCLSAGTGDMAPNAPHGLFLLDTRVLSEWALRLNGHQLEALGVAREDPFAAVFVARGAPGVGAADADLVAVRRRHIGRGMRERIQITNNGLQPASLTVELRADVDFASLFEVKESRVPHRQRAVSLAGHTARFVLVEDDNGRSQEVTVVASQEPDADGPLLTWRMVLAPHQSWEVCLEVALSRGGTLMEPRFRCSGADEEAVPVRRMSAWRTRLPTVSTDCEGLARAIVRSGDDLGALRIFDPDHPEAPIVAAGAPWFMTLFGRDSLLTSFMTLPADATLAAGVLETLARLQGTRVDPATEEEPGKILHEVRFGSAASGAMGRGEAYYGSVDATPLFVMVLGELRRWGLDRHLADRLLPHADRALEWIDHFGDCDGDGYVEYERHNPRGLANQGWKDSWDAIRFADGQLAEPPIALCEVQAYVYAAYVARAHFAREGGDEAGFRRFRGKADDLRRRFNEDFWLEEQGCFAIGLDGRKRPIDAVASNMGHCLWTGIVEPERAHSVAERLLAPDMFSGWGVRTLASTMAAYNPVSYHNGSVWPHDNALCAAGLSRYGFFEHAHRIIEGQLAVASERGGSLPELFAGFDRREIPVAAAYPASCSPQAWAAAAPLLWLTTLLRLDPWVPRGKVWLAPKLPEWFSRLQVDGLRLGEHSLWVSVEGDTTAFRVEGDLEVVRRPREPLTATME